MTAISEVTICNMALSSLNSESISVIGENSENGRLCEIWYAHIRDSVLQDFIWSFAQKRAVLAELAEEPVWTEDGMTVVYQKPVDCLKINFVNILSAIFKIESDKILSNEQSLKIKYTSRVTDPNKFFTGFTEALISKLSARLAYPITSKRTLASDLYELYYKEILPQAKSMDSQQGSAQQVYQDEWLLARRGVSSAIGQEVWHSCY